MPPQRGFIVELALFDETLEYATKHLALGGRCLLNVKQQVAVIDRHRDTLSFETCFCDGQLEGCDEFSRRLNAAGSDPTRLNNAGRGSDGLEGAVQPTDA